MSKKMISNLMLLLTAIIWGSAFVAQKSGMDYIEPFTYGGIRTFIGGLVLIPVIIFMGKRKSGNGDGSATVESRKIFDLKEDRTAIIGGLCCGAALFAASSLQQFGLLYTTAGKAGFITTLYVVFVPIFSLFLRKRVRPIMWICVVLGGCRTLSALYDGCDFLAAEGRYAGADMCGGVCGTYFGDRLFCTESGRS